MFGKKDNGAVKEKKKSGVLLMIATVAVGAAVFVGLVSLQNSLIERPETVDVVVTKSTVADNSFIDKGKAGDYFQVIKVNKDAAAEGAYKTLDDVDKELPAYISNDMTKNSMLTNKCLNRISDKEHNYKNKAETGFKVESIDRGVAGTVRAGDYITIKMLDKQTGEETGSYEHVYVAGAYGSDGASVSEETAATVFNIWIESDELTEFNRLLEKSSVRISLDNN